VFRSSDRRAGSFENVSLEQLAGRVHLLSERVDTLAQTISTTASSLAKRDGDLAVLRRELESDRTRVEALVASPRPDSGSDVVRDLEKRVAALTKERVRSADERRFGELEAKLALLAERIDTLSTTVATTAAGMAGREGEIAALRHTIDDGLPGGALVTRIDDLSSTAASASMRLENHSTQIDALREALDENRERLEGALGMLAERVDAAEQERAVLATSVGEAAGTRWRELERMLESLGERIDAIDRDRAADARELERATSLWPAALRSLELRVNELVGRLDERPHPLGPISSPTSDAQAEASPVAQPPHDVHRFLTEIRALERWLETFEPGAASDPDDRSDSDGDHDDPMEVDDDGVPVGADVLQFRNAEP
jgi:chromosome segregation ATPase